MWNWLSRLLGDGNTKKPSGEARGDKIVPDDEYDFKVGTKPMLPAGLRSLKITEVDHNLLVFTNFDADLTVDCNYMNETVQSVANSVRALRWAKTYHELDSPVSPPVRLHSDNVLLTASHYSPDRGPEDDIQKWLDFMKWDINRPFLFQQITTAKPLEDGYFSCLRITAGDHAVATDDGLAWGPPERSPVPLIEALARFAVEEIERVSCPLAQMGSGNCEQYLKQCYQGATPDELAHPVFALLDFPAFDMGIVKVTVSGSVWSESELRFWTRPTYLHK